MKHGLQTKFNARLKKKRADGTVVFHDNKLLNFILKIVNERGRF